MTLEEFKESIIDVCPTASFGEDRKGQIIVFTGLIEDKGDDGRGTHELLELDGTDEEFDFDDLDDDSSNELFNIE